MVEERAFDVVIVGSGAGGGAAASELSELCRHGLKVAVLEQGPEFQECDLAGSELDRARRLYFNGGGFLTKDKTVSLALAKAYGGSTVVYTGTSLAMPRARLEHWGVKGLGFDDLQKRSKKYLAQNNAHELPDNELNDNNKLFAAGCRKLGLDVRQFPVNVKDCRGGGQCNLGCERGAKQGTNRVQLPKAQANGALVVTNCKVERLEERMAVATVANPPGAKASAWADGRYLIRAPIVVVAAGAVNTPALLLRSGVDAAVPQLGKWFTCQPSMILVGQHEKPITNFYGHPKSFYVEDFVESKGFLLETCMYFPFITAKSLSGFGADHALLMSRMDTLQMILALAIDEAEARNRVTIGVDGEPIVDYRLSARTLESLAAAQRTAARIFFAAGARRLHAPAGRDFFIEAADESRVDSLISAERLLPGKASISAAHLMGGCRMGETPADSVTDSWGQVHGLPWLFVADASLFPKAAGINPYITIMALADRAAERVKQLAPDLLGTGPLAVR